MSAISQGLGRRLSTEDDFPQVTVYERQSASGPVYCIAFDNLEFGGMRELLMRFFSLVLITLFIPGALIAGMFAERLSVSWVIGIGLFSVGAVLVYLRAYRPFSAKRTIELDFGQDRLRVTRNGKVAVERTLSRLHNLTVENHPEAEFMRASRQESGNKQLMDEEKQHCLIGWFGVGGSEQVVLLSRAEWPNRNSLFEVRQAVMWAKQREPAAQQAEQRKGLNPPLD